MRDIKFRAWYKPLGHMIQPDKLESINFETKVLGAYLDMDGRGFHKLRMSDFELMQYTGLKDKNGKEIYEGDIVEYADYSNGSYVFGKQPTRKDVVRWNRDTGGYKVSAMGMTFRSKEYEIIGNIYEHEHLLRDSATESTESA